MGSSVWSCPGLLSSLSALGAQMIGFSCPGFSSRIGADRRPDRRGACRGRFGGRLVCGVCTAVGGRGRASWRSGLCGRSRPWRRWSCRGRRGAAVRRCRAARTPVESVPRAWSRSGKPVGKPVKPRLMPPERTPYCGKLVKSLVDAGPYLGQPRGTDGVVAEPGHLPRSGVLERTAAAQPPGHLGGSELVSAWTPQANVNCWKQLTCAKKRGGR